MCGGEHITDGRMLEGFTSYGLALASCTLYSVLYIEISWVAESLVLAIFSCFLNETVPRTPSPDR